MLNPAVPPPLVPPTPALLAQLREIVGPAHALLDGPAQAPYLHEWRDRFHGRTAAVVRPRTTAEVAAIVGLCCAARVGVVPQGGNTGLVGGQIPDESGDQIVLSLGRLNRIRSVDAEGGTMVAEAGVTLAAVRAAAQSAGRQFPISLASEGSCQIGGILATNAGGINVLAHGTARANVLGLEVVLADGRVWGGLRALRKDNTGYDLRDLLVGSEGTLGIITAACLRLAPVPAETATAFAAVPSLGSLGELFRLAEAHGGPALVAFEFLCARALHFVTTHIPGARAPLQAQAPWTALIEFAGHAADGHAQAAMEALLAEAMARHLVTDATIAPSLTRRAELWRLREAMSEAQKFEGASLKHDIAVPVANIAQFVALADALAEEYCPGARPVPFGHFGDGNVHYNVSQPVGMDKAEFLARGARITDAVHALALSLSGSISAEHGIGQLKREGLSIQKSPLELELMARVKAAFDPAGILNPGKLLP